MDVILKQAKDHRKLQLARTDLAFIFKMINYHFKNDNEKRRQITLIEIENINHYNQISGTSILPKDFRRNIITEGIRLNELVGSEFFIGNVKVKAHDLCRPCKYLQESLHQKNIIKELLLTGGLRCEILSCGRIYINDQVKC